MPTLMTEATFAELNTARSEILPTVPRDYVPANVFVPWAGSTLLATGRGIYFVGIAIRAEDAYGEATFEARLQATEHFCSQPDQGHTPFWKFVDRVCVGVFGKRYDECQDRWGWSNLLKIAGPVGSPDKWERSLVAGQIGLCRRSFAEELLHLRNSLVVILSGNPHGILPSELADQEKWNKEDRPGCTYWINQADTGNTFVHCNHPKHMILQGYFEDAVGETVSFCQSTLPPF